MAVALVWELEDLIRLAIKEAGNQKSWRDKPKPESMMAPWNHSPESPEAKSSEVRTDRDYT